MATKVIIDFLEAYERSQHTYQKAADRARKICEAALEDVVGATFESRAKTEDSLRKKLVSRDPNFRSERFPGTTGYQNAEDIRGDVKDIAGCRIIMYYPAAEQLAAVDNMIYERFDRDTIQKKEVAGDSPTSRDRYKGVHYRVRFQKKDWEMWKLHRTDVVEIQVRSAAHHVWATINHGLRYKPKHGDGPTEEINTLMASIGSFVEGIDVIIARIYRVKQQGLQPFAHKHDLGSFLEESMPKLCMSREKQRKRTDDMSPDEVNYGTMNILLQFLEKADLNTRDKLSPILKELEFYEMEKMDTKIAEKRKAIDELFGPKYKLKPSVYIIQHILNEREKSGNPIAVEQPEGADISEERIYQTKCRIIASSLIWVYKLFSEWTDIYELIKDDEDPDFQAHRTFMYKNAERVLVMTTECRGKAFKISKQHIDAWWKWFGKQDVQNARPLVLAFKLSQLGVQEALPHHIEKLRVGLSDEDWKPKV